MSHLKSRVEHYCLGFFKNNNSPFFYFQVIFASSELLLYGIWNGSSASENAFLAVQSFSALQNSYQGRGEHHGLKWAECFRHSSLPDLNMLSETSVPMSLYMDLTRQWITSWSQESLQDPVTPGNLLDELVENWHSWLCEATDEIIPQCPLCPHAKLAPWYTLELWRMKWELRQLKWG